MNGKFQDSSLQITRKVSVENLVFKKTAKIKVLMAGKNMKSCNSMKAK